MKSMILKSTLFLFVAIAFASMTTLASAAKKNKADEKKEDDPLEIINREIASLEARLSAIEHIKLYADSVNLQELQGRDIEQTVAHFVKSTRKS